MPKIAIIGAGAAGCFCATLLRRAGLGREICIYEAGKKALAKVAVTGGGRCNLTNSFEGISKLEDAYPRGARLMKKLFCSFSHRDTQLWFENEGVALVTQADYCVFPHSQNAMEIVGTLLRGIGRAEEDDAASLRLGCKVTAIQPCPEGKGFILHTNDSKEELFDTVVVTSGGMSRNSCIFGSLDHTIEPPVPSLFSFSLNDKVKEMMGTVVDAGASIAGTKFKAQGPLLITDWGMSGPAILKLSSYAARYLAETDYQAPLLVNWLNVNDEQAKAILAELAKGNEKKFVRSVHPEAIPSRLWTYIADKSGLRADLRWNELGKNGLNRLCNTLVNDSYQITGKTRFKEEFVTCGGISLNEINHHSLESKKHPGLYFAGEVLDVDAVTGGFNLQAAWTMGYVAANDIITKTKS